MLRPRRTRSARRICTWRCYKKSRLCNQHTGNCVRRHADGNCGKPPGRAIRNNILFFQYHGKRTRPEVLCQIPRLIRNLLCQFKQRILVRYMHNQRIVRRPPLRRVNFRRCRRVKCVPAKPVHSFGRERHQPARTQNSNRLGKIFFFQIFTVYFFYNSFHISPFFVFPLQISSQQPTMWFWYPF